MIKRLSCIASLLSASAALSVLPPMAAGAQDVRVYVNVDSISVGERIDLTVAVDGTGEYEATFPTLRHDTLGQFLRFGDLLVVSVIRRGTGANPRGGKSDSVVYEATTFALDTARVAPIPVLIASAADTLVRRSDPFIVPVRSVLSPDANDILDLMPIAEFRAPVWPWLLLMLVLVGSLTAFIFWYRRSSSEITLKKGSVHAALPPDEEAYRRLEAAAAMNIDSPVEAKVFCVELSDIARTYLWRRMAVHALEMTTAELVDRLRIMETDGILPAALSEKVNQVLQVCDLGKFADIYPDGQTGRESTEKVRELVGDVESYLAPAVERAPESTEDAEVDEAVVADTEDSTSDEL